MLVPCNAGDLNFVGLHSTAERWQGSCSRSRDWSRGSTCPWLSLCSWLRGQREHCVAVQLLVDGLERYLIVVILSEFNY